MSREKHAPPVLTGHSALGRAAIQVLLVAVRVGGIFALVLLCTPNRVRPLVPVVQEAPAAVVEPPPLAVHDPLAERAPPPPLLQTSASGLLEDPLTQATLDRFTPFASDRPDPRWGGCWMSSPTIRLNHFVLRFGCPDRLGQETELILASGLGAHVYTLHSMGSLTAAEAQAVDGRLGTLLATLFPDRLAVGEARVAILRSERRLHDELERLSWRLRVFSSGFSARLHKAFSRDARAAARRGPDPAAPIRRFWARVSGEVLAVTRALVADSGSRACAALGLSALWLVLTGTFGYGRLRRADLWGLVPVPLGLLLRLGVAIHGNSQSELYFPRASFTNPRWFLTDDHSVVFSGVKALFVAFAGFSDERFMTWNGVVGALVAFPLFLFVTRRFESLTAGLLAGILWAADPLLVRFSPTDSHFPFLLFWWFAGLALLSGRRVRSTEIVAGFVCLGIAGGMRIEAGAYVVLALLLVRWRCVLATRRTAGAAALGIGLAAAIVAANFATLHTVWIGSTVNHLGQITDHGWDPVSYVLALMLDRHNQGALFILPALLGLLSTFLGRRRNPAALLVLATALGAQAVMGACNRGDAGSEEHKLLLILSLQAVLGGLGLAWAVENIPRLQLRPWVVAAAALVLATGLPLSDVAEMRTERWFNGEYFLLRDHLSPLAHPEECTVFWYPTGDDDLATSPAEMFPGLSDPMCGIEDDCLTAVAEGGCQYFLWGNGCESDQTLTVNRKQRVREECQRLLDATKHHLLEARKVDTGTVGFYRLDGRKEAAGR